MMFRIIRRFGLNSLLVVGTTCALTMAPVGLSGIHLHAAHAMAMHGLSSGNSCHTTKVVLNENNPPSISCVDSAAGAGPDTSQTGCNNGDLFVYDSPSGGGNRVCFSGSGSVDLNRIPWGLCCNADWNDRAESYSAGNQSGKFYYDTGDSGQHWIFYGPDNTTYNFNAQFTNQASSLCINNVSGPNGCPN